jgi:hypothetical protein
MKLTDFFDKTLSTPSDSSVNETETISEKQYPGKSSGALKRWINRHYNTEPSCRSTTRVKNDPNATNFYKKRASWYQNIHCKGSKQIMKEDDDYVELPDNIVEFIDNLTPNDVGVEQIGDYKVHFEGFSDACKHDANARCTLHPNDPRHLADYDHIYDEVLNDFIRRENGVKPVSSGLAGSDDNPVMYAVFHTAIEEDNIDRLINESLSQIQIFKKFDF